MGPVNKGNKSAMHDEMPANDPVSRHNEDAVGFISTSSGFLSFTFGHQAHPGIMLAATHIRFVCVYISRIGLRKMRCEYQGIFPKDDIEKRFEYVLREKRPFPKLNSVIFIKYLLNLML